MRYIPLKSQEPDADWVKKANQLLERLKAEKTKSGRAKLIKNNSSFWGELKDWLLSLSNRKCWFSEAKDCFSHWQVEHFRPKNSALDEDGTEHDGYWWLAFDWTNFRIIGSAGNPKKGTHFPLRDGCNRIKPFGDVRFEDPMLLDPADPEDPSLLSFNVLGEAIIASHVTNPWQKKRVNYSIVRCNLGFGALVDKRKTIWNECWERVQKFREESDRYWADQTNIIARQEYKNAAAEVRKMLQPEKELSAVARACVYSTGDPRVTALLNN